MRRFSKSTFLVLASSRSTASSCEFFLISASICLASRWSLAFSSTNLRSICLTVSSWFSSASRRSRRSCSCSASSFALSSLNSCSACSSLCSWLTSFSSCCASVRAASCDSLSFLAAARRSTSRSRESISRCCSIELRSDSISSSLRSPSCRKKLMICRASPSRTSRSRLSASFSSRRSCDRCLYSSSDFFSVSSCSARMSSVDMAAATAATRASRFSRQTAGGPF
mmetsp:Transcript_643/g.1950  ORF Transcript_643/g.1950 Transcript_643/m.1950 type:complete len:226 (+) Transcript_643:368-1045(+)